MTGYTNKKIKEFNNSCGGNFRMKFNDPKDKFYDFKLFGNNYTLVKERMNFRKASKFAQKMGGYLMEDKKDAPLMGEWYNAYKKIEKQSS